MYGLGRIRKGNWYKRNEITLVPPTSFLLYKDKQIKESDFYLYMNKENKKVKNSRRGMRPFMYSNIIALQMDLLSIILKYIYFFKKPLYLFLNILISSYAYFMEKCAKILLWFDRMSNLAHKLFLGIVMPLKFLPDTLMFLPLTDSMDRQT